MTHRRHSSSHDAVHHSIAEVSRRDFVRVSAAAATGLAAFSVTGADVDAQQAPRPAWRPLPELAADAAARSEPFWQQVRVMYNPDPALLDFDHGNSGAVAQPVIEAYVRRARQLNRSPNIHYPRLATGDEFFEYVAKWLGARADDVALQPNATTGLNAMLRGFPLRSGDEVLVTNHEYPDMIETLQRRANREGIVVRTVEVPNIESGADLLVERVQRAITPATRLLLVSHISAWNGEVLPVAQLCRVCRSRGVAVLVDAAQSVGVLPIHFDAWGADFLAASFHKAAGAPIGTGVLLMRAQWVGKVEPMHPPTWDFSKYPIDQYAWTGTTNVAAARTVMDAMQLQSHIGLDRKRARLTYLAEYWQRRARDIRGFRLLTPTPAERNMGYASFAIDHVPSRIVAERMRNEFRIEVQDKASRPYRPFDNAVRVTPQPYTSLPELDRFVRALRTIARS